MRLDVVGDYDQRQADYVQVSQAPT